MVLDTASRQLRQRNFLRVSFDGSGKKRSPNEQDTVLNRDAEQGGREVVGPAYSEVGSASKYATAPRDAFPQLLADLRAGTFGAEVLGLWETSRGSRQMEQSLPLINALADAGVTVWVHTRRRTFDPRNAHDRADLLSAAVKDELASAETSERVLRDVAAQAEIGAAHGLPPFGYRHVFDEHTGKFVERVIDESEAAWVREAFERTGKGESMKAIADDFAARGLRRPDRETRSGKQLPGGPYSPQHLGAWLRNPAYAAVRVHWSGRKGERTLSGDVKRYAAQWPAIVEPALWADVSTILASPDRAKARPGRARHLLGGIAVCGRCNGKLHRAVSRHGTEVYRCQPRGCCSIEKGGADGLDELALKVVAAYLGSREYAALAQPNEATSAELDRAKVVLADAVRELAELTAAARKPPGTPGHISVATVAAIEPALRERQVKAQVDVDRLSAPSLPAGLVAPGADARARLDAAPFTARRATLAAVLVPAFLGELVVMPLAKGWGLQGQPARERTIMWRSQDLFRGGLTSPR